MSLAQDLLAQAESLARLEARRPKQASLRRAVSASYYALFHLLVEDAATHLARGVAAHRDLLARTFQHGTMREVCERFARGNLPPRVRGAMNGVEVPEELSGVAGIFVNLQLARNHADYDRSRSFTRKQALHYADQSAVAFEAWSRIRREQVARLFVLCLLTWNQLKKGP